MCKHLQCGDAGGIFYDEMKIEDDLGVRSSKCCTIGKIQFVSFQSVGFSKVEKILNFL